MNAPLERSQQIDRREFLKRTIKASALLAALGVGAFRWRMTHTRIQPQPVMPWPDFSRPNVGPTIAIASGAQRRRTLRAALDSLGGLRSFVEPGDRVLIKVNAAFSSPPSVGATTHPELIEELIVLCRKAGADDVVVADYPINEPETSFRITGIAAATAQAGGRLHIPSLSDFEPLNHPQARLLRDWPVFASPLRRANKLIGVAPVKDHARSGASMTLKNWYGFLGGQRALFHQQVHEVISELAVLFKPTFVVLDGTMTMFRNGPTGGSFSDLKPTHCMIVATDPVAADAFGATLLGRKLSDLPFLTKAAAAGAGTANFELLNPVRVNAT